MGKRMSGNINTTSPSPYHTGIHFSTTPDYINENVIQKGSKNIIINRAAFIKKLLDIKSWVQRAEYERRTAV